MEVSNYMKDGMIADWDTFEQVNLPLCALSGGFLDQRSKLLALFCEAHQHLYCYPGTGLLL